MRLLSVLGWWAVAGLGWAETPFDLNSPFEKVALVRGSTGAMEERAVSSAKIQGNKIELVNPKGAVALFPLADVTAILPKYPAAGTRYQLEDLDAAIRMLESLPEELKQRPEASLANLQQWKELRKPAEEADAKRREAEKRAAEEKTKADIAESVAWILEATNLKKARSEEELRKLKEQGQNFLDLKVGDEAKISEGLAFLSQVVAQEKGGPLPDLVKLDEIQPKIIPEDLMVWATAGILILSLFGLLIGLSFTSTGLTRFREGALLGGVVYGGVGVSVLGALAALWWPHGGEGEPLALSVPSSMTPVIRFSKNTLKPVYFLPSMEFQVTKQDFVAGLLGSLPPADEATGIFKGKFKQGQLWIQNGYFTWSQGVTALGIPIPATFVFHGKPPNPETWQDLKFDKVFVGKIALPDFLAVPFMEAMKTAMQNALSTAGYAGIKVRIHEEGNLLVRVDGSGKKPELPKPESAVAIVTTAYRKEISAEDLAKAFSENKGGDFDGRFVVIDGIVDKVRSGAELSGGTIATEGSSLNAERKDVKISDDQFDVFYLKGMENYGFRKDPLYIKCVIKSPFVFAQDKYGDVYFGANANIVKDKAFIKKGYRVRFLKEGRVQGDQIKNNEIEVYGVEIDQADDILCFDPSTSSAKQ